MGAEPSFSPGDLVLTVPSIWVSKTFAGYQLIEPHFLLSPNPPKDVLGDSP